MGDPVLHLFVGPNGAGKTTLFQRVVEPVVGLPWINADEIAAAHVVADAYAASRAAAEERQAVIEAGRSFATETVFSHLSKVELVRSAVEHGYLVTMHLVLVPVALAVARVEVRVENGGHDVPVDKTVARFERLWPLVVEAIDLVREAYVYDNTSAAEPFRLVATFRGGRLVGEASLPTWAPVPLRDLVARFDPDAR